MVQIVAGSGKGADQQRPTATMLIRNSRDVSVRVTADRLAVRRLVLLQEIAAVDLLTVYFQRQFLQQVGREFDVAFASAEELIEPVVRLRLRRRVRDRRSMPAVLR